MTGNSSLPYVLQFEPPSPVPPYSHQTHRIIGLVLSAGVPGVFALFGVVSNTVNIIVFYRQGILSHSSIVSLTALAVSDFMLCFFGVWSSVCALLLYGRLDSPTWRWHVFSFSLFTASRPMNYFTSMTSFITAFTTAERIFSVVFPSKVKAIFSPKKSMFFIVVLYVVWFILDIPNFFDRIPVWERNSEHNVTILRYRATDYFPTIVHKASPVLLMVMRFGTILVVGLCNMIIFQKVKVSLIFRNTSSQAVVPQSNFVSSESTATSETKNESKQSTDTSEAKNQSKQSTDTSEAKNQSKQSTTMTTKEMKLLCMVTAVATVFFVCYVADIPYALCLYVIFKRGVDFHWYWGELMYFILTILQVFNSSVNILIYLTVSSSYRREFKKLFNNKQN